MWQNRPNLQKFAVGISKGNSGTHENNLPTKQTQKKCLTAVTVKALQAKSF